jgi:acetyltransferase-like isoleucine patch superfamily enzyme
VNRPAALKEDKDLLKLYEQFLELHQMLSVAFEQKYQRSLPLADMLLDRWERARKLGFGEASSIYDSAVVLGEVKVGKNTWIGPNTMLDGSGKLIIGDFCSISTGVQIYSHDSVQWSISGGKAAYEYAGTSIGNNCYIGPNTIIAKGVVLGDGCIVGANSFVNKSYKSGSKIAGTPAKLL